MSESNCTSEQAMTALSYLRQCFGGYTLPQQEERAFLRLFVTLPPSAIRTAVDELVRKADRRPSPNDVAQIVRKQRPVTATTNPDPLPDHDPAAVSGHVTRLKAQLRAAGAKYPADDKRRARAS